MTVIREEGKVNEDTTLIDIKMFGVPKITAIYAIESGKKCLVDAGTHTEARKIFRQLKELDFFPPDKIVLTHSHWDHCQAIPFLNQKAMKEGKEIEIYASKNAIPNLKDQSYNEVFGTGPFNNIEAEIIPLKEGDTIDLDGISLKIFETPGHMTDSLAILDEKNRNLFIGDTLGDKISDNVFVPPCMPPFWDKDAYLKTIDKIKRINYETISLPHFGLVYGEEAKRILDESIENLNKWWIFLEQNINNLDDIPYMIENVLPEVIPKAELDRFPLKLKEAVIFWISEGFKKSKGI
jgi:glyoxylase-like metal-dependent hydrolase (beta-lactamase superfamily II)